MRVYGAGNAAQKGTSSNLYQEKSTSEAKNILEAKNCMKGSFLEKFIN